MSKSLDQVPGNSPRIHGKLYAFLIAFISALGGFLFGYDLAIIGGANVFLEKQFHLSPAEFGLISASAVLGCIIGPFLAPGPAIVSGVAAPSWAPAGSWRWARSSPQSRNGSGLVRKW